jgi:poly(A) polymerase
MAAPGELPSRRALYRYYRDVDEAAIDTLYLNLADYLGARGPDLDPVDWQEHCRVVGHILSGGTGDADVVELPKLIDGNDLMQTFDLEPGPLIGELLETVWEAQAEGLVTSREEASELVRSRLSEGVGIA